MKVLALLTFGLLVYEIALSRLFAYALTHHFAPIAMSTAMMGLGAGAYMKVRFFPDRTIGRAGVAALMLGLAGSWLSFRGSGLPWLPIVGAIPPCVVFGVLIADRYAAAGPGSAWRAYAWDLSGGALGSLAAVFFIPFLVCLPGDPWVGARPPGDKPLHRSVREEGGRILDSSWGVSGRADLYARADIPNLRWIYNDALNSSFLVQDPKTEEQREFLKRLLLYLPFEAARPDDVLILGPGGGLEVHLARFAGATRIAAAELSDATIRIVDRARAFAGPVYEHAGVDLTVAEGRRYLIDHPGPFDLIQMSLVLTATPEFGSFALSEAYLYTEQAYRLYLDRLRPDGMLAAADDSRERSLRQLLSLLPLVEGGRGMDHAAIVRNPGADGTGYAYLLLFSPEPLSETVKSRIYDGALARGFVPLWIPGRAAVEPFATIARVGRDAFLASLPVDLGTIDDDRPYFFYMGKGWRYFWRVVSPLFVLGALSLSLAAVLGRGSGRAALVAACLGSGFMLVEVGLLHKLALAIGGPTRSLSVLLFSLLLSCGAGSVLSKRLARSVAFYCIIAAAVVAAGILVLRPIYLLDGIASAHARAAAVALMVGPVGVALGMPFPRLLVSGGRDSLGIARLWGVNGFASVFGATTAMAVSLALGNEAVLAFGAGFYLLGAGLSAKSIGS